MDLKHFGKKIDPIDCFSDICHMSWIAKINRDLLSRVDATAKCSNGTSFQDLAVEFYGDCVGVTPTTETPYDF